MERSPTLQCPVVTTTVVCRNVTALGACCQTNPAGGAHTGLLSKHPLLLQLIFCWCCCCCTWLAAACSASPSGTSTVLTCTINAPLPAGATWCASHSMPPCALACLLCHPGLWPLLRPAPATSHYSASCATVVSKLRARGAAFTSQTAWGWQMTILTTGLHTRVCARPLLQDLHLHSTGQHNGSQSQHGAADTC